jgi:hypothetical protein
MADTAIRNSWYALVRQRVHCILHLTMANTEMVTLHLGQLGRLRLMRACSASAARWRAICSCSSPPVHTCEPTACWHTEHIAKLHSTASGWLSRGVGLSGGGLITVQLGHGQLFPPGPPRTGACSTGGGGGGGGEGPLLWPRNLGPNSNSDSEPLSP